MGQVLSFAFTLRKVGMKKTLKAAELLAVRPGVERHGRGR